MSKPMIKLLKENPSAAEVEEVRESFGMRVTEFAKAIRRTPGTISLIEKGVNIANWRTVDRINKLIISKACEKKTKVPAA
jgi:DNA-binding XRE family transcriptional regulator